MLVRKVFKDSEMNTGHLYMVRDESCVYYFFLIRNIIFELLRRKFLMCFKI